MGLLDSVTTGIKRRPRAVLIYGSHGAGKTTWSALAPNPIFISAEPGQDSLLDPKSGEMLNASRLPLCTKYEDVLRWIKEVGKDPSGFKTIVIDSITAVEKLLHVKLLRESPNETTAFVESWGGFGKPYEKAKEEIDKLLAILEHIRNDHGMNIIIVGHANIKRFNDPEGESYDRYTPMLHEKASASIQQWADEVLFLGLETFKNETKTERTVASTGRLHIRTRKAATHDAKNRLRLPEKMSAYGKDFWSAVDQFYQGVAGDAVEVPDENKEPENG